MAAPTTKWYLSWVVDVKEEAGKYTKCLLKSTEDGSLAWWENVGYYNIPLELSDKFPSWKYNDEQFSFGTNGTRLINGKIPMSSDQCAQFLNPKK